MSDTTIKLDFGSSQMLTSERMKKNPALSKFLYSVFGYTNVGNWARSLVVIKLFKKLPLKSFKKILDVGAGLGEFSFMLSKALPEAQITSLEIWQERADILEKTKAQGNYNNVTIYRDKIETMEGNGTYDFIFAIDVFEHIYENEMPFKGCWDKLKPGGYLMVKIPNIKQLTILPEKWFEEHQDWLHDEHVGQVYDLDGLVNRFKKEGFSIVHASNSDGWFSRLGWEVGYLSRKGGSAIQLLTLPLSKLFIRIDRLVAGKKTGNAIQVIGKKP
ncbi:class I SAM-dependent methyltransferase [Foetidibacter luteolus]|uniref:class I SAM-dependent methyltransferase n=1 Tax=Foetidibacter luteolus TaxID=2608880 RepID=UPI00129ABC74|nr:class I SAM-dependent methyltransferase [Foetidibacter luteolus]